MGFLSGRYDQSHFKTEWGCSTFIGPHYTKVAVQEVQGQAKQKSMAMGRGDAPIDFLLTSEWPSKMWGGPAGPRLVPTTVSPQHTSPAVAQLHLTLRPHFHVCGSAGRFREIQTVWPKKEGKQLETTNIALAEASSITHRTTAGKVIKRWNRVLTLRLQPGGGAVALKGGRESGRQGSDSEVEVVSQDEADDVEVPVMDADKQVWTPLPSSGEMTPLPPLPSRSVLARQGRHWNQAVPTPPPAPSRAAPMTPLWPPLLGARGAYGHEAGEMTPLPPVPPLLGAVTPIKEMKEGVKTPMTPVGAPGDLTPIPPLPGGTPGEFTPTFYYGAYSSPRFGRPVPTVKIKDTKGDEE